MLYCSIIPFRGSKEACPHHLVILQITISLGRSVEQKCALYKRITKLLAESCGIRPEDVFINIIEVGKENWLFEQGIAQYAAD